MQFEPRFRRPEPQPLEASPAPVSIVPQAPSDEEPGGFARSIYPRLVEAVGETLWVILLLLVIGFFVSKGPTISSIFDDASSAFHRGGEPSAQPHDTQIRDLELRMTADERKLSTLERGYSQLKQRHADLLRAYTTLQQVTVAHAAGSSPHPAAR